jgi:hypothetical protein
MSAVMVLVETRNEQKIGQRFNFTNASITNIFRVKEGKRDSRRLPDRHVSASMFCTTLLPYIYVMITENNSELVLKFIL